MNNENKKMDDITPEPVTSILPELGSAGRTIGIIGEGKSLAHRLIELGEKLNAERQELALRADSSSVDETVVTTHNNESQGGKHGYIGRGLALSELFFDDMSFGIHSHGGDKISIFPASVTQEEAEKIVSDAARDEESRRSSIIGNGLPTLDTLELIEKATPFVPNNRKARREQAKMERRRYKRRK